MQIVCNNRPVFSSRNSFALPRASNNAFGCPGPCPLARKVHQSCWFLKIGENDHLRSYSYKAIPTLLFLYLLCYSQNVVPIPTRLLPISCCQFVITMLLFTVCCCCLLFPVCCSHVAVTTMLFQIVITTLLSPLCCPESATFGGVGLYAYANWNNYRTMGTTNWQQQSWNGILGIAWLV